MADGVRIRSSCLGKRQSRAVSCELCAKAHCDLFNFELVEELQFIGEIINERDAIAS